MDKKKTLNNYYRIKDIVNDIYVEYLFEQSNAYGAENIDGEMLAEEAMLLVLDILLNRQYMSDKDIRDLAIRECRVKRSWDR